LHTRLWKGQSNFTLERFIAQHRNAFVSMQAAAEHVTYQLPNDHSRVGYLLDAIQFNDAGLQAAMASIKQGQTADGMRNNFEAAASHLLPYDPVQKKRVDHAGGGKRGSADISETTGEEANVSSSFGTKKGTGSSGVSLRYHTKAEYDKLPADQKEELCEWRKSSAFNKKGKGNNDGHRPSHQFDTTKAIAPAVEKNGTREDRRDGNRGVHYVPLPQVCNWKSRKGSDRRYDSRTSYAQYRDRTYSHEYCSTGQERQGLTRPGVASLLSKL
jgi:hypothetical protein